MTIFHHFGLGLPNRAPEAASVDRILDVASRAEELGFRDVWVSDNTIDHAWSIDPWIALSAVASVTSRVGLGLGVVVLPLLHPLRFAHNVASLDRVSGGRVRVAVGIGKESDLTAFGIPVRGRVTRTMEAVAVARACWSEDGTTSFTGSQVAFTDVPMAITPVQDPVPLWFGGVHERALRRAAIHGDGWLGAGAQGLGSFRSCVSELGRLTEEHDRDGGFAIAKRVFVAVDDDERRGRAAIDHWFQTVYRRASGGDAGIGGTLEQVIDAIGELRAAGAEHVILNPVHDVVDQAAAAAAVAAALGASA